MKMETPVIEIKNLSRRYGHLEAVNGLNITVQPGRCYGFFGRNGAGKTTVSYTHLDVYKRQLPSTRDCHPIASLRFRECQPKP